MKMTNNSDRYKVDKDQVNDKNLRIASHKGANVKRKNTQQQEDNNDKTKPLH